MRKRNDWLKKNRVGLFIILFCFPLYAQVEFSGDISAVSTYVFRGIKANNGPALQGSASIGYNGFTLGFWGSSVDFGDNIETETDLFAEYGYDFDDISVNLGFTAYSYDFNRFNGDAGAEYELYGVVSYDHAEVAAFFVPNQASTIHDPLRSNYWLELSGDYEAIGAVFSMTLGYGTYSSRWLPGGAKKEAASLLTFTADRKVTENVAVFATLSHDIYSGFENIFYFGASLSF